LPLGTAHRLDGQAAAATSFGRRARFKAKGMPMNPRDERENDDGRALVRPTGRGRASAVGCGVGPVQNVEERSPPDRADRECGGQYRNEREVVVRLRSEQDDLRDVVVALVDVLGRVETLVRELGEETARAARPPGLLDKRDVATRLNVSVRQVDRLVAARALPPALRIGTAPRWRPEQIEAFVNAGQPKRRGAG
jgi:predicted DNA-binding transcriptional regulator AlpA